MGIFETAALVCGAITAVGGAVTLIVRGVRWFRAVMEGLRCQLRSEMLRIYYHNLESGTIRQYELQNFLLCFKAYKALGGNSFIDEIHEVVLTWKVIS